MPAAVLGDFLSAGRQHLQAAVALCDRHAGHLPAVVLSLHQLVTVMCLCAGDLAPCDEIEAAGRTDLHVWERAIIDAGAALRIAAGCLHGSAAEPGPGGPPHEPAPPQAYHLAQAATALMAGRDLLHTHTVLNRDGFTRERSDWAPVVTSLPVTRALADEIAGWSAWLAPLTVWLAGSPAPQLTGQPPAVPARDELASASRWLRTASAVLRPAAAADPVRAVDAELLHAIPAAFPPPRQPLGAAAESVAELCAGITVSASRLRAAMYSGPDGGQWPPPVTSDGWQWMAQAAAVTSHLSELALRALAAQADRIQGLAVPAARLHRVADSMTAMQAAWQRVDHRWNAIAAGQRTPPTWAMSEASDMLLRMGRLVWDNPAWTPARARRGSRRHPGALAPGMPAFTAVVSAVHQAADALARVADTDSAAVAAAARAGRLYVPARSLPAQHDVPAAFMPARISTVRDLRHAYQRAGKASTHVAGELDELAVAVAAPSKVLRLARAAALAPARRRDGHGTWPGDGSSQERPGTDVPFRDSRASTGQPGPVERAVRQRGIDDPGLLLRAAEIDNRARALIDLADDAGTSPEPDAQDDAGSARDAVLLSAESFPHDPAAGKPVTPAGPGTRPGGPAPGNPLRRKA